MDQIYAITLGLNSAECRVDCDGKVVWVTIVNDKPVRCVQLELTWDDLQSLMDKIREVREEE